MDRYEKLTMDLREAKALAKIKADKVNDTGTCNMDGIFVRLPRWNKNKTENAIRNAGLSGFKIERHTWYGTGYLINPPFTGQAYKREVAAETMYKVIRMKGYDVFHWHQID